jgi:putative ABC transport system permease protein
MAALTRLRAHAGLWSVVGVLSTVTVFVASSAGPAHTRIADTSLRQMVATAPYVDRDIITVRPARPSLMGVPQVPAEDLRSQVVHSLPDALAQVMETSWGYQHTSVATFDGVGATLTGAGVVAAPHGFAPVVSLHHQPGLVDEIELVEGEPPQTDLAGGVVEVMVAAEVAEQVGLVVGRDYALHPGRVVSQPDEEPGGQSLTVRVSGVFVPRDPGAPVWDHAPLLLSAGTIAIPADTPPLPTTRAALVTDEKFFRVVFERTLTARFEPVTAARVRLDEDQIGAAWVPAGIAATAQLFTDPRLIEVERQTGLANLLRGFQVQASAAQAVIAVTASGVVAVLLGLLLLAARLIAHRRRAEVGLLRARGGSVLAVAGRLAAEAGWVVPLAAVAGWVLHHLAANGGVPSPGEVLPPGLSVATLAPTIATALAATLMVPFAGALVARQSDSAMVRRRDVAGLRSTPARLTVEVSVIVLAVLGVFLIHRRGLSLAGVDPYLSAVPVLLAVAAGLLALRVFPWPVRVLAAVARRLRGLVGFVGLARVGRAAPGAALALLVLVLAVAVGGFAGAVNNSVDQARELSAVQQVGAHVRLEGDTLPAGAVAAVARLPGVTTVVPVSRGGTLSDQAGRAGGTSIQGPVVVAVDAAAYQELLAALGVETRLPPDVVSARPGATIPALAGGSVATRDGLSLHLNGHEQPLEVVGPVTGLPGPDHGRSWVLVPRQALPQPAPLTGLLVAGAGADPARVRDVVSDLAGPAELAVSSVAEARAQLEASGFNDGLTLVFVTGTVGGAAGGALAVALALVVQARTRGRVLSLLRTMGLSNRQARGLLLVELLPVTVLAVVVGAAVGVALPHLLAPALGLDAFTGGVAPGIGIDTITVASLAGLIGGLVLVGVGFEAAVNRRLGLGGVLRVE